MLNFLNSIFSSFHRKPSVSYVQPKTINIYFQNSLEPKYILLNICHYNYCDFEVVAKKEGEENIFGLYANLHGTVVEKLEIGIFETRKEAENAMKILKNKLFALDKKLVKLTGLIVVLTILVSLIGDFSGATLKRLIPLQVSTAQTDNTNSLPFNDMQEMQKIQKEMQKKADAALKFNSDMEKKGIVPPIAGTPPNSQVSQVATENSPVQNQPIQNVVSAEQQGNPEVNNFVSALGK